MEMAPFPVCISPTYLCIFRSTSMTDVMLLLMLFFRMFPICLGLLVESSSRWRWLCQILKMTILPENRMSGMPKIIGMERARAYARKFAVQTLEPNSHLQKGSMTTNILTLPECILNANQIPATCSAYE